MSKKRTGFNLITPNAHGLHRTHTPIITITN